MRSMSRQTHKKSPRKWGRLGAHFVRVLCARLPRAISSYVI